MFNKKFYCQFLIRVTFVIIDPFALFLKFIIWSLDVPMQLSIIIIHKYGLLFSMIFLSSVGRFGGWENHFSNCLENYDVLFYCHSLLSHALSFSLSWFLDLSTCLISHWLDPCCGVQDELGGESYWNKEGVWEGPQSRQIQSKPTRFHHQLRYCHDES